ncbi:MAG TPA: hypothetical protein VKE69_14820, partial [Planctomycetota bacterium]|nr:hypothetical protein [Planctomycetota bacterium]
DAPARAGVPLADARRDRIARAFGEEVGRALVPVSLAGSVAVAGFVGTRDAARNDASGIHLYVNGRFVRDRGALRVLRDATKDVVGLKQPVAFLLVSLDPALVDVNVHPAKLEVRFRRPEAVYGSIHRAVREALAGARPVAGASSLLGAYAGAAPDARRLASFVRETPPDPGAPTLFPEPAKAAPARPARFLRAFDTFLVRETDEGLEVIDQHALHERVNFERLLAEHRASGVARQTLLVPELVDLAPAELALSEEWSEIWRACGLEVETYGPKTVAVRAVPASLRRLDASALVRDLLALAREDESPRTDALVEEVLHRAACRGSVMAGDVLSDDEIVALLAAAGELPAAPTCPHGRPARIRITRRDLERAFERT